MCPHPRCDPCWSQGIMWPGTLPSGIFSGSLWAVSCVNCWSAVTLPACHRGPQGDWSIFYFFWRDAQVFLSTGILLCWAARSLQNWILFCTVPSSFLPAGSHSQLSPDTPNGNLWSRQCSVLWVPNVPKLSLLSGMGVAYLPFLIWKRKNCFQADSPWGNTNRHFPYNLFSFIFKFIFTDSIGVASLALTFTVSSIPKKGFITLLLLL